MELLRFIIEAKPVPASRPKVSRYSTYYPKAHTVYANYLKEFLQTVKPTCLDEPFEVRALFVMPRYKTSDSPAHRADVDNLSKLPLDSMTKATLDDGPRFWKDDNLIVGLTALKRYAREGEEPHTKIRIIKIKDSMDDHVDRMFEA